MLEGRARKLAPLVCQILAQGTFDLGLVSHNEPFKKVLHQGMILGSNNEKMSKSRGNVVNPDAVIEEWGADSLRLFEMFMGPFEQVKPWQSKGIVGVHRFLKSLEAFHRRQRGNFEQTEPL